MSNLFMRFPGGRAKAVTLSYDDAVQQDIRFMEIINRYGLKCTFNINAGLFAPEGTVYPEGTIHRRLTEKQVLELYTNSGHEVAVHGYHHPFLDQLPDGRATYEIIEDRRRLEELFGHTIRGMAYPWGTLSDNVVEILRNAGIVYARTVEDTESFEIPTDWLRLPATARHTNPRLMELADAFLEKEKLYAPWLFYLWGHSYEFEKDDNWQVIENFGEKMSGHADVWYATNIEIFDYITAYRQLRFGVDMKFVENPTATELYFEWNEKSYRVKAGECLWLD